MRPIPFLLIAVTAGLFHTAILQGHDFLFNVPYTCSGGKTLTVRRCEIRGGEEMCTYDREQAGRRLPSAMVRRSTLKWLATCQPTPGQSKPRAGTPETGSPPGKSQPVHNPPTNPAAAQAPPAAGGTWPPRELIQPQAPTGPPTWTTQPTNPPYLAQFPAPEHVRAAIRGRNPVETSARLMGAFSQLSDMINQLAAPRGLERTPDETRLFRIYGAERQWYQYKQNAPPTQEQARWQQLQQQYEKDTALRDEMLQKLFAAEFRAAYRDGRLATKEMQMAALDEINRPLREQRERAMSGVVNPAPMSQRDWARCLAVGNSENTCLRRLDEGTVLSESGRKVMDTLGGMFGLSEDKSERVAPGPALAGAYAGAGELRMAFGAAGAASIRCGNIISPAGYRVEWQANQVQVRLVATLATGIRLDKMLAAQYHASVSPSADPERWQDQRIALSIRADGKLAGAGPIRVTGPVAVGSRTVEERRRVDLQSWEAVGNIKAQRDPVTNSYYEMRTVTSSVPVYENRTITCTLGVLTPLGKVSDVEKTMRPEELLGGVHGIGQVMDPLRNVLNAASVDDLKNLSKTMADRDPDPGLRMQGRYAGPGDLDIEFLHQAAVVGCRQAAFPRDYTVAMSASRILVTIQNGATPITLELKPNGMLAGSGSARLEGRALVGMDVNAKPVFRPLSDSCTIAMLEPSP
ncbi:MAG: hypothetical protein AB1898_17705 [Acidobacteriota bacterium]